VTLCEITPVGGEPYYADVPIQQGNTQKFLEDLTEKHTKGYRALSVDPNFYPVWIFPIEVEGDNLWWVSYYYKDSKGRKFLEGHPLCVAEGVIERHGHSKDVMETLTRTFDIVIYDDCAFVCSSGDL